MAILSAYHTSRRPARFAAFVLGSLTFIGCGGDSSTSVTVDTICSSPVNVSVTQGSTTPTISWSPSCKVQSLSVEDAGSGTVMWAIGNAAGMSPPITYGVAPGGAIVGVPPAALLRGTAYGVSLF